MKMSSLQGLLVILSLIIFLFDWIFSVISPLLFLSSVGFIISLIFIFSHSKDEKKSITDELMKIRNMDGLSFEYYAANILRNNGFNSVRVTKGSGDFGADIIADYNGSKYVIQCKKYEKNVGISAVQQIYAAKVHYKADAAAVLTNVYFTPAAQRLSSETGVILWDRNTLLKWIANTIPIDKNRRKNKKTLFIILAMTCLIIMVFAIIYGANENSAQEAQPQSTLQSTVVKSSPVLTIEPDETPDQIKSYIGVMRKGANVRQEPDAESKQVGFAKAGERITIIEPFCSPKWHKVIFDDKEAYISANYCIIQNY